MLRSPVCQVEVTLRVYDYAFTRAFAPSAQNTSQEDFAREVAARFGLVPNFFGSTPDSPLVIRELWLFAKSAYLDTPIPTLFKDPFARQIDATITYGRNPAGYAVTVTVSRRADRALNRM